MLQSRNDAYIIEVDQHDAGVAIRDGNIYHFVAADWRYRALENRKFQHVDQVQRAAERLRGLMSLATSEALAS
ncbi:MAG: hypothetical protein KJ904_07680 [Alphaproteobacteria bacterium]|nr:hypothetical protein [Alphaproteobacteria bacterium]MBU0798154.1 hypothetical protein [Alphaproteobacteria bacterium]MBU0887029.1 hypothetical protein [Alphaproteobacteria bacterium]MBU1814279.1 hypothetical protein [Alphaproteobacteria bacterium]